MNWLTRFSVRNVAAILILVLLISGGGLYTATQLKMESMPDINFPVVVAITPYPGASPEDISKKVTEPIEKAVQGVEGMQKLTSVTADNTSVIVAQFDFDADLDKAQQEMEDLISKVPLPEDAMETTFNRFGFNSTPLVSLSVTSESKSTAELERLINDEVKPALDGVNGVGEIQVKGEGPKAVYIRLKPDKLKIYNLSAQSVQQALQSANMSLPLGDLSTGQVDMPVRIDQKITSVDDLRNYELTVPPNQMEGMQQAFDQIGQGFQTMGQQMGALGQAVGGLGQAVNGIGQAVNGIGQGVAGLSKAQATQADLVAKLIGLQIALNEEMSKPEPDMQKVGNLYGAINGIKNALNQLSAQLSKAKAPSGGKLAGGDMPSMKMPKGKTAAGATGKPKMEEAEIKTVKLSDIASITESAEDHSLITRTNGKPSVNIDVIKDQDANIVDVADGINAKLAQLKKSHPELKITTMYDQSKGVKASIHSMVREGLLGALFASAIILIFLREFRMTLISIVSIPVSILATLILLQQADITLNIMTLGGLAVAIGRVVDDSIVVIENIHRHLMQNPDRSVNLIQLATKEVAAAITSSTLTTVAVFIPLGFVTGIVGEVFYPFALTVAFSLLCSLVVAVTIVPVLAKLMLLKGTPMRQERSESRLARLYRKSLAWALDHKAIVMGLSTVMLIASLFLIPLVGTTFLPAEKEKTMRVTVELPSGTDLRQTDKVSNQIEALLRKHKEVKIISTSVGNLAGQLGNDGSIGSSNRASMFVSLAENTEMDTLLADVRNQVKPIAEENKAEINVAEMSSMGVSNSAISISIRGQKLEDIKKVTDELTEKLKTVHGLTNVSNNLSAQKDIVTIHVDDAKAAKKGLMAQQVAMSVRGLLQADKVMEIEQGNESQEVKLGLEEDGLHSIDRLKKVEILSQTGDLVRLDEIATIKQGKGPVSIQKEDTHLYASVSGDVTVKDTGAVSREILAILSKMKMPSGVTAKVGGDTEEMNKSFAQLGIAMIVAVFAVYLVMLIAFGEATAPFTILFSLPFAVIGGLVGLYVAGQPISVSAMIGALMLIGIVVTNAIVLIDRVMQKRKEGLSTREALLEAGETRLRPILMTALATVFALLPLGLGYGEGTLLSQGLAVVVIGGLLSSTLLTLFIVPIVYQLFVRLQDRLSGRKGKTA
ncbi:efflux RND transporter permease subunit [Laceyella putida]|uniref:Efflux RND transporter permease subunit n=1 Tax=Laceyella putida TaxID=110101 RepID=A0ABW2RG69_9BACL